MIVLLLATLAVGQYSYYPEEEVSCSVVQQIYQTSGCCNDISGNITFPLDESACDIILQCENQIFNDMLIIDQAYNYSAVFSVHRRPANLVFLADPMNSTVNYLYYGLRESWTAFVQAGNCYAATLRIESPLVVDQPLVSSIENIFLYKIHTSAPEQGFENIINGTNVRSFDFRTTTLGANATYDFNFSVYPQLEAITLLPSQAPFLIDFTNQSLYTIAELTNLRYLRINSAVIDDLPTFLDLVATNNPNLEFLDISDIDASPVPSSVGQLSNLRYLRLSGNNHDGDLLWINSLTRLQFLDLSNNNFMGPLPPQLFLNPLTLGLILSGNNQISGILPGRFAITTLRLAIDNTLIYFDFSDQDPICNSPFFTPNIYSFCNTTANSTSCGSIDCCSPEANKIALGFQENYGPTLGDLQLIELIDATGSVALQQFVDQLSFSISNSQVDEIIYEDYLANFQEKCFLARYSFEGDILPVTGNLTQNQASTIDWLQTSNLVEPGVAQVFLDVNPTHEYVLNLTGSTVINAPTEQKVLALILDGVTPSSSTLKNLIHPTATRFVDVSNFDVNEFPSDSFFVSEFQELTGSCEYFRFADMTGDTLVDGLILFFGINAYPICNIVVIEDISTTEVAELFVQELISKNISLINVNGFIITTPFDGSNEFDYLKFVTDDTESYLNLNFTFEDVYTSGMVDFIDFSGYVMDPSLSENVIDDSSPACNQFSTGSVFPLMKCTTAYGPSTTCNNLRCYSYDYEKDRTIEAINILNNQTTLTIIIVDEYDYLIADENLQFPETAVTDEEIAVAFQPRFRLEQYTDYSHYRPVISVSGSSTVTIPENLLEERDVKIFNLILVDVCDPLLVAQMYDLWKPQILTFNFTDGHSCGVYDDPFLFAIPEDSLYGFVEYNNGPSLFTTNFFNFFISVHPFAIFKIQQAQLNSIQYEFLIQKTSNALEPVAVLSVLDTFVSTPLSMQAFGGRMGRKGFKILLRNNGLAGSIPPIGARYLDLSLNNFTSFEPNQLLPPNNSSWSFKDNYELVGEPAFVVDTATFDMLDIRNTRIFNSVPFQGGPLCDADFRYNDEVIFFSQNSIATLPDCSVLDYTPLMPIGKPFSVRGRVSNIFNYGIVQGLDQDIRIQDFDSPLVRSNYGFGDLNRDGILDLVGNIALEFYPETTYGLAIWQTPSDIDLVTVLQNFENPNPLNDIIVTDIGTSLSVGDDITSYRFTRKEIVDLSPNFLQDIIIFGEKEALFSPENEPLIRIYSSDRQVANTTDAYEEACDLTPSNIVDYVIDLTVGDLNRNGFNDLCFSYSDGVEFFIDCYYNDGSGVCNSQNMTMKTVFRPDSIQIINGPGFDFGYLFVYTSASTMRRFIFDDGTFVLEDDPGLDKCNTGLPQFTSDLVSFDYDNDGDLDLGLVCLQFGTIPGEVISKYYSRFFLFEFDGSVYNNIFEKNFYYEKLVAASNKPSNTLLSLVDMNNDGYKDIVITGLGISQFTDATSVVLGTFFNLNNGEFGYFRRTESQGFSQTNFEELSLLSIIPMDVDGNKIIEIIRNLLGEHASQMFVFPDTILRNNRV